MRHIGKADGDLEAQRLMDAMDEDGDGGVSMAEFATHVTMGQLGKDKAQIKATFDMVRQRQLGVPRTQSCSGRQHLQLPLPRVSPVHVSPRRWSCSVG